MGPDWLWVSVFSLGGLAMGLLTTFVGIPRGWEVLGWLGLYLFFIMAVLVLGIWHPFWTFLLGSMTAGLLAGTLEAAFIRRFRMHNPWYADLTSGARPKAMAYLVAFSVSLGTVLGVFLGGLAWALSLL